MENYFYIPANYLDSGYVLNGRFAKRNGIEAIILGVLGFLACQICNVPFTINTIQIYIFVCLPLMLIGAAGIQDDPLSVFIMNTYRWLKKRKPYFYNNHGVAYRISAAQLIIERPNMRDVLTDKWDQLRNSMSTPKIEYEEGVNFVFAEDPEMTALQEAEERLLAEEQEKHDAEQKSDIYGAQPITDAESALDVISIADHLVLQDYEEDTNGR